jgi:probable HAF family extracellular repeat protein
MNTYAIRSALVGTLGVVLALASGSASAITFRITDLGTFGGTRTVGLDLNASGQATGFADMADGVAHAFLWDGTTLRDLGALGGAFSAGFAINDSGWVTGSASTPGNESHAFLWDGTRMLDLGTLGGVFSEGRPSTPRAR